MALSATQRHRELHLNILRELGHTLPAGARVLDFGCGPGQMVLEYQQAGYDTFGCDISITRVEDRLRPIRANGALPFPDNHFDFVFSDQVVEHVQDHDRAFSEIARVMKPGAIGLHIFPSRLKPIESHLFVPLGGFMQQRWWLRTWATLGVRNSFQRGQRAREVARLNSDYLKQKTNYLSRHELIATFRKHFEHVQLGEKHLIKHGYGKARLLAPVVSTLPFLAQIYGALYSHVIVVQKKPTSL